MCHGDDARDVNPVEINLVEEELRLAAEVLRHTAGCDARNPSPFGGRGNEGSMIKSGSMPKAIPHSADRHAQKRAGRH